MILDIPTGDEVQQAGITFLNISWESAIDLLLNIDELSDWEIGDDEVSEKYWEAAEKPLATSLALAQQGIELLLKGRIASVSPFLLISSPREWPSHCDRSDTPFADFRTIDAQDLVKVHDTVCGSRLQEDFKQRFEQLRRLRNTIFHTVDRRVKVKVGDVLMAILEASDVLVGPQRWFDLRRERLTSDQNSAVYSSDHVHPRIVREVLLVVDSFKPAEIRRFLGLNKRQRRYLCPDCHHGCMDYGEPFVNLAQLEPNSPTSTNVHCIACKQIIPVIRKDCRDADCNGNVIEDAGHNRCLTCGWPQDEEPG